MGKKKIFNENESSARDGTGNFEALDIETFILTSGCLPVSGSGPGPGYAYFFAVINIRQDGKFQVKNLKKLVIEP